jgi:putative transposase
MPLPKCVPHEHTEAWDQIKQLCLWPEQRRYELLLPVVLYGDIPAERAAQTGANERTLRRQADQFETEGLLSFFRPSQQQLTDHHRSLPPPLRQLIVDLKAAYPAFSLREIAQICFVQFGRRPSQPTIKQVLADGPAPSRKERRFPHYRETADPFQRRRAVITLHLEGWMPTSIAACAPGTCSPGPKGV